MSITPRRATVLAALVAVALTGCGAPQDEAASTTTTGADQCAKDNLALVADGKLTIGTDKPAYPPWFVDDDPSNGKGYESAVAYAIADQMGFAKGDVTWTVVPFNKAVAPGKKDFDFDINQVSINDKRKSAVDFSSGYYTVAQAVVTTKGSKVASAKTVADLKDAKLGAQVGTTSYDAIGEQIKPSAEASVFDTNDVAVQALKNGQVDALVVDLPTAFYMTAAQLDDGVIFGQLPSTGSTPEEFGAVLDKGSALTPCVSAAVDALREDGTLDELAKEWLANKGAPELK
ncbi:ABC transporter substrate-binding protein [Janibacter sp. GXQ6167]|uniref:ABC transporter substrate-binding protein n=1 Tax=Janibacter sp. GXQ6167 TaxID=3240791 RepID=UPI0035265DF2